MSKKDYLTEDNINPVDQKFVCLSFFSKNNIKKVVDNNNEYCDENNREDYEIGKNLFSIKVRGCFSTLEEASKHAKNLQSIDEYHNVYVAEAGKWCPFILDDEDKYVKSVEYANDELNTMMKQYMENQEKAKIYHEFRKNDMIKKSLEENLVAKTSNLDETKSRIENAVTDAEKRSIEETIETMEEQIQKLEIQKKEIDEIDKNLSDKLKLNK
jgi:hypothetical protein